MRRKHIAIGLAVCVLCGGCGTAGGDVMPTPTATVTARLTDTPQATQTVTPQETPADTAQATPPDTTGATTATLEPTHTSTAAASSATPEPLLAPTSAAPVTAALTDAELFAARGYSVSFTSDEYQAPVWYKDVELTCADVYIQITQNGEELFYLLAAERIASKYASSTFTTTNDLAHIKGNIPEGALAGWQVFMWYEWWEFVATYDAAADTLTVWQRNNEIVKESSDAVYYGKFFPVLMLPLNNESALERPFQLTDKLLDELMTADEKTLRNKFGFSGGWNYPLYYWLNTEMLASPEARKLHVWGMHKLSAVNGAYASMPLAEVIERMGCGEVVPYTADGFYSENDSMVQYTSGTYCYTFYARGVDSPSELVITHAPSNITPE